MKSLLNPIFRTIIYIFKYSKNYNRFNEPIVIPDFIQKYDKVKINYIENDYGPASKFIGTLESNSIDPKRYNCYYTIDIVKKTLVKWFITIF